MGRYSKEEKKNMWGQERDGDGGAGVKKERNTEAEVIQWLYNTTNDLSERTVRGSARPG